MTQIIKNLVETFQLAFITSCQFLAHLIPSIPDSSWQEYFLNPIFCHILHVVRWGWDAPFFLVLNFFGWKF